ncbi:MAG: hemerythrin domain-containing protein [Lautropia sp.]
MSDLKHDPDAPAASQVASELGYGPMDSIHAEFTELLTLAAAPGDKDWVELLGRIDAHLREHFAAEDGWMRETEFPPRECHIDEHAAVLKSSSEVLALARQGNLTHAVPFTQELARWFPGHADYLDSALAAWMCKRRFGGKPVVLHRRMARSPG